MDSNSFNSKVISLSPTQIIDLSLGSLDTYSFDDDTYSSSLTNDVDTFNSDAFTGSFRWTDLTKVADASPRTISRLPSIVNDEADVTDEKNELHKDLATTKDQQLQQPLRRGRRKDYYKGPLPATSCHNHVTELGGRISLLLSSPTNSPRSAMTGYWNNQVVGRKTLKLPLVEFDTAILAGGDENDYDDDDIISLDYESLDGSCM